jgi:hypothetical protein
MKYLIYGTFCIGWVLWGVCMAAPEPSMVPSADIWTVGVGFEHPQQIVYRAGDGKAGYYWYTIVTLTNNSGKDADFYPSCELVTDSFQIVPAGKETPEAVFELIKKRHGSTYQFLERLEKTDNKILQGADNAKDIAIIWPDFDTKAKGIKLYISGLSNETAVVEHPLAKDQAGQPEKVYLRKTLELGYALRGDPSLRSYVQLAYQGKRWVMR